MFTIGDYVRLRADRGASKECLKYIRQVTSSEQLTCGFLWSPSCKTVVCSHRLTDSGVKECYGWNPDAFVPVNHPQAMK